MSTAAALAIALVMAAQPAETRSPSNAMVAFNDGCDWPLESIDTLPQNWESFGWQEFQADPASPFARHLSFERGESGGTYRVRTFRQQVQGRMLYLALSEREEAGARIRRTCTMLDYDASDPIPLAHLVPWSGRHPDGPLGDWGQPRWGHYWEPGLSEGHDRTEIFHVPAASPLRELEHIGGMIFTGTRLDGGSE